ncbi:aminotransferase class III-fold pyridoxal phosphate-dependent enzyme, partial [Acinetobacter baumannii]
KKEVNYCSINYDHLPVTITRGKGIYLFDENSNEYIDFLSGYSVVNQGHCHPRIINTAISQLQKLTLSSRSFYNDKL